MPTGSSSKANAAQGAIVHRFVHDLKNKIGGLSLLAELFSEQDEATQREILAQFKQGSMEALRLSEVLMDDLEIDRKLELNNLEPLNFSELITNVIHKLETMSMEKGISMKAQISPDIMVDCQREQIVRIPEEMIRNAIKFCSSGDLIEVLLTQLNNLCVLTVKDNGPGLSQEEIPNMFKRYVSLSNLPTNAESSMLRGSADAQLIANAHNTSILVESEGKGRGCTFSVKFPVSSTAL